MAFFLFISALEKEHLYCLTSTEEEELLEITNFWKLLIQGKIIFFPLGSMKEYGLDLYWIIWFFGKKENKCLR